MSINTENAAKMIEEAVTLREWRTSKKEKINPVEKMTVDVGLALCTLLVDDDAKEQATTDWDRQLWEWMDFTKDLLILLGKPDVLQKLPGSCASNASEMLGKLYEFFKEARGEYTHTNEWLTWLMLTQYSGYQTEATVSHIEEYYNFKNREESANNYFHNPEIKRLEDMKRFYPEVRVALK